MASPDMRAIRVLTMPVILVSRATTVLFVDMDSTCSIVAAVAMMRIVALTVFTVVVVFAD